jgi:hypothetical protein
MSEAYLTAEEIYAIDDLTDITLGDYITPLPKEKKELVLHYFAKIRTLRLVRVVLEERDEYNRVLRGILDENGIKYR